jgi:hypothetical protein
MPGPVALPDVLNADPGQQLLLNTLQQLTAYTMADVLLPMSMVICEEATLTAGCTPSSSISGVRISPAAAAAAAACATPRSATGAV